MVPPFVVRFAKNEQVRLMVKARSGALADDGPDVVNLEEPVAAVSEGDYSLIRAPPRPIPRLFPRIPPDVVDLERVLAIRGAPSAAREADLSIAPPAPIG